LRYPGSRLGRASSRARRVTLTSSAARAKLLLAVEFSRVFYQGPRPGHATTVSPTPSKPVAPALILKCSDRAADINRSERSDRPGEIVNPLAWQGVRRST
jgi:hypothetical protein